uniref:Uncharacterized protein n=1 Tax=Strigamia maritima TaxID=126957 RepID=T1J650_STRMM
MLNPNTNIFIPGPMGAIVIATSIIRLILITFLFTVNLSCLFKLYREGKFDRGFHYILHVCIFASNLCYICTWFPFVFYGLFNGSTIFITYSNYCFIQNSTANIIGFLFLVLLLVYAVEKVRVEVLKLRCLTTFRVFFAIVSVWLLPLIVWNVFETGKSAEQVYFNFIEDFRPVETVENAKNSSLFQYKVGFMVCEVALSVNAGRRRLEKYLLLVLPIAFVISCCLMVLWMHRCVTKCRAVESQLCLSNVTGDEKGSSGWQMAVVDLVLYTNLAWQAVIRPLMLAETLKRMCDSAHHISFFDVGSHLILTISAVFAPTSCPKTWFSFRKAPISVSVIENKHFKQQIPNPENLQTKLVMSYKNNHFHQTSMEKTLNDQLETELLLRTNPYQHPTAFHHHQHKSNKPDTRIPGLRGDVLT